MGLSNALPSEENVSAKAETNLATNTLDALAWTKQYALWDSQRSFNKDTVTQSWEDAQRHAPKTLQSEWTQLLLFFWLSKLLYAHLYSDKWKSNNKGSHAGAGAL